jgi:hypothetical protein
VHPRFQPAEYRATREVVAAVDQSGRRSSDSVAAWGRTPEQSAALVGTLDAGKIDFAARLLSALPAALEEKLATADGAAPVLVALLLAEPEEALQRQLEAVEPKPLAERALALVPLTRRLGAAFHLPVIDLALPALKAAPEAPKKELLAALEAVINADRRVSLHEFVVLALVREQLAPRARPPETKKISDRKPQTAILLTLVAHAGASGKGEVALQAAMKAGAATLGISEPTETAINLESVNAALEALRTLAPMEKGVLMKGLFAAATVDGTIRLAEAELLRLVGAVLACPLPPLLDALDPATLAA